MEHPRWTLAEAEMETAEYQAYREALARVLIEAGNLRLAVTVIDAYEPEWRQWVQPDAG